jgi:diacylglycerol kinase
MPKIKNYFVKRIQSFSFAFKGISALISSEPNAKIHLMATFAAISAGLLLNISLIEWCIIIFAIALVWISEAFNTVIEKTMDQLLPDFNEKTKYIKDVSAGAVLISSIAALIAGLIIFVPKLF